MRTIQDQNTIGVFISKVILTLGVMNLFLAKKGLAAQNTWRSEPQQLGRQGRNDIHQCNPKAGCMVTA